MSLDMNFYGRTEMLRKPIVVKDPVSPTDAAKSVVVAVILICSFGLITLFLWGGR